MLPPYLLGSRETLRMVELSYFLSIDDDWLKKSEGS
jgi:hypothetical protein